MRQEELEEAQEGVPEETLEETPGEIEVMPGEEPTEIAIATEGTTTPIMTTLEATTLTTDLNRTGTQRVLVWVEEDPLNSQGETRDMVRT